MSRAEWKPSPLDTEVHIVCDPRPPKPGWTNMGNGGRVKRPMEGAE